MDLYYRFFSNYVKMNIHYWVIKGHKERQGEIFKTVEFMSVSHWKQILISKGVKKKWMCRQTTHLYIV